MQDRWMDLTDYECSLHIQQSYVGCEEMVLGFEHPLTVTLGKRAVMGVDVLASADALKERGVTIARIDRGGQATLHNPGQLVIYPILDLRSRGLGIRDYVCALQKTTQKLLLEFDISTTQQESGPGLYVQEAKIAFFGVRVQKGWTSHGVAINIANNLEDFSLIRSCGKAAEVMTKLENHRPAPPLAELFRRWCDAFAQELAIPLAGAQKSIAADRRSLTAPEITSMLENPLGLRV